MLLDNTQLIRGVGVKTPVTQLVRKGYAARGLTGLGDALDPSAPGDTSSTVSTLMTAINSEAGFLTNLVRAQQGKPPLPPQATAPSVNVGFNLDSLRPLAVPLAVGLGAWLLLRRRRR